MYKLLKWVNVISEENKKVSDDIFAITVNFQGLRVIKTVLDIKGAKRFKKNAAGPAKATAEEVNIN